MRGSPRNAGISVVGYAERAHQLSPEVPVGFGNKEVVSGIARLRFLKWN